MKKVFRRDFLASTLVFTGSFLSACQTLDLAVFPEITFNHLKPINLRAKQLKITELFQERNMSPNIEHKFPVAPKKVMRTWASTRIKTSGSVWTVIFSIKDASVTEVNLKTDKSIKGFFVSEQSHQFNARVEAQLELTDLNDSSYQAIANASATRSHTIEEGASINKRHQLWFEMTELIMADFNSAMESSIKKHFGEFLL